MGVDKKILFGVDDSDFARQALAGAGAIVKDDENIGITIYHGRIDRKLSDMMRMLKLSPEEMEKHQHLLDQEEGPVLKKAEQVLIESGFDPKRVSTLFEANCEDPSESIMKLANSRGFETLAVARWGSKTLSRQFMGPVPYRLANMAHIPAVWIMDPRVRSHDVLIALVGAPVSRRVMEYTLRYFAHLKESRFTFIHVVPPLPAQCWDYGCIIDKGGFEEQQDKISRWLAEETNKVTRIADEGRKGLIQAGVPSQNIAVKLEPQEQGITRDILHELETGDYGILVIGRKGSKNIREFGLGSKANKLLHAARTKITCMVS